MKEKILIVDDEIDLLKALSRYLSPRYEVTTASSADEGLSYLKNEQFAVIFTDYNMPGKNGIAFLEEALLIQPDAIRIIFTAYSDLGIAFEALNKGKVFEIIEKPDLTDQIEEVVHKALERYHAYDTIRAKLRKS